MVLCSSHSSGTTLSWSSECGCLLPGLWQPLPTEPSGRALLLQDEAAARPALPPKPPRGQEAQNQPPLPHRLRGGTPPQLQLQLPQPPRCEASRQAPARQTEDAPLRELLPTAAYTTYRGNEWRTYRLGRGILSLRGHCCGVPWQPHSFHEQSAATRGTTDGMAITQCTICQLVMGRAASPMLYSRTQTAGATRSQFPFSTILTVEGLL